jgi:two-component system sensor histidine kinase UhpB
MKILPLINSSFQTLEHIINVLQLGTWEWNIQTGIVQVNRFWYAMLGYDEAEPEMSMQAWQDMIHHDDIQHVMDAVHAHLSGASTSYKSEFRLRHRDGGWIWVEAKGKIVEYDNSRSPLYFCGTHMDITKQKVTEEALRATNDTYRFLFRNTSDAILVLKDGFIVEENPGALKLFGCNDKSQLLDKHPAMISPEFQADGSESRQKAEAYLQSAASGEQQCFEWLHTRMNGTQFFAEVHLQHLPAQGEGAIIALVRPRNIVEQQ